MPHRTCLETSMFTSADLSTLPSLLTSHLIEISKHDKVLKRNDCNGKNTNHNKITPSQNIRGLGENPPEQKLHRSVDILEGKASKEILMFLP